MSQIKKLAGETLIYGLGSILPKVLNFLLLAPYLTRILNTESYGIYGILYAYIALLIAVFTFRLETAYFRFTTKGESQQNTFSTAIWMIIIGSLVFVSLILLNSDQIAGFITSEDDGRYIRWFAFILAFDALAAIPFARLRLENKAIKFSVIKIINVLITAFIIIFFLSICPVLIENGNVLSFYDSEKELDYVFLANLVASGFVILLLGKELLQVRFKFDRKLILRMLQYSWPLIIVGVAAAINQVFDRVFIANLLPGTNEENTAQSGIYNGAAKVAVLMSLFATAFNYAAEPFFFKSQKNLDAKEVKAKVAHAFTIVASLLFLTITLFSELAQYLIGVDFRAGMEVVPILLMAYLFLGLYYNFSIWYKLNEKTYFGAIFAICGAIVTISLNLYLIPVIGYTGAAWSVLFCYVTMCVLAVVFGRIQYPIPYSFLKIGFYIFLALGLFVIDQLLLADLNIYIQFALKTLMIVAFIAIAWRNDRSLLQI